MASDAKSKKSLPSDVADRKGGATAAALAEWARVWRRQNAGAIADYNAMIETSGIPLSEYRKF